MNKRCKHYKIKGIAPDAVWCQMCGALGKPKWDAKNKIWISIWEAPWRRSMKDWRITGVRFWK